MKLYPGRVGLISRDIIEKLTTDGDIEVLEEEMEEAVLDVEAILNEYLRLERELSDRAKEILENRNLDFSYFYKIKKQLFDEKKVPMDETVIDYLIDQMLEMFMHSNHIYEVYADDNTLRGKIGTILKKEMTVEEELDREVREHIKNLEENTSTWEIEYKKILESLKKTKGYD